MPTKSRPGRPRGADGGPRRRGATATPDPAAATSNGPEDSGRHRSKAPVVEPSVVSHRLDVLLRTVAAPGGAPYTDDEAAAGITELAGRHVISGADLHQIRVGTGTMPSLDALSWIATLFDLPVAYFLDENPDPAANGHPDSGPRGHLAVGADLDTDRRDRLIAGILGLTNGLSTDALEAVSAQLRHARSDEGLPAIPTATDSGTAQSTTTRRSGSDAPLQVAPLRPHRPEGRPSLLSTEQRRAYAEQTRTLRADTAAILAALHSGEITPRQLLLRRQDPIVARLRLDTLIPTLPGWDQARTTLLLTALGAPAHRMIRGLRPLQRQRLAEMLTLGPELVERALTADEDAPGR